MRFNIVARIQIRPDILKMSGMIPGGGGGGGTLIFSHIRRLGPFFFLFKILNFNNFLGFQRKSNIFGGYEDFVDIFWGVITKLG